MINAPSPDIAGSQFLVTGGRGFIGSVVCQQLASAGAKVWTVGRTPSADTADTSSLVADLADLDATRRVFDTAKPDIVLHLASHVVGSRSPDVVLSTYHSNLTSTVNLLLAAQENECRRVVLTGSLEEPDPSDDWPVPSSPYAAAKLAAGSYGRMFNALFGLSVVTLRVFMVYGPGQSDETKLIPYVITSLLKGEVPTFTSGVREVDWIHVDDVAKAYLTAAVASGVDGKTLDVGTGELATVRDVVEKLFSIIGSKEDPAFGAVEDRQMEQVRRADVQQTNRIRQWKPTLDLDSGVLKTVRWYRERG